MDCKQSLMYFNALLNIALKTQHAFLCAFPVLEVMPYIF